jgi:chaperonin GroES
MSSKVIPLAGYVVVRAEEAQSKTASGLYVPGGATEKPKVAKVLEVGEGVASVKVGDRVLYKNEYEATKIKVDGEDYTIVYHANLVAVVK